MITNRNSTTMAPAYTITCTAARKCASCATNSTATPSSVATSDSAECTGWRAKTTPSAPATMITAHTANTPTSTTLPFAASTPSAAVIDSDTAPVRRQHDPRLARLLVPLGLGGLGVAHAVTELARPLHDSLERGRAVGRRGPHPRGRAVLVVLGPVLPRQPLRATVVADQQLVLGVDRVLPVLERELEQLRLGDRLRRACLHAQVAVDAAQEVDLVD